MRHPLFQQGYDRSAPGRPEPFRGGETNFERSPDRWFRLHCPKRGICPALTRSLMRTHALGTGAMVGQVSTFAE